MKKLLPVILLSIFSLAAQAQVFESAFSLYEAGDYTRAARIFEQVDEPRGYLFTGKSYYQLSKPQKALYHLDQITIVDDPQIKQDALLTKALCYFQLKRFGYALDTLFELSETTERSSIYYSGQLLYNQILKYLTVDQRYEAFQTASIQQVRYDILESSVGLYSRDIVEQLVEYFATNEINGGRFPIGEIELALSDSLYEQKVSYFRYPTAPQGMMYNVGVVLPSIDPSNLPFEVSQQLYFGILMATETFNANETDKKVFLTYLDSESKPELAEKKVTELVWQHNVDVIVGPLFSEMVEAYSEMSEKYQIPLIAPLANADSIALYNNFAFQFNPSFEVQGKKLAEYAVKKLEYDTLAVLAESNGLGAASAYGFRYRAQELGAHVAYFDVHDLESKGYDIRDYTKVHTIDTLLIDSLRYVPVDAIYAPFTGIAAQTLVESLLTDLEALRSDVNILGSEEWNNVDLDSLGFTETDLSYTTSFDLIDDSLRTNDFESTYRLRFNREPTLFSFIGFDVMTIVLQTLDRVGNPAYFRDALKNYKSKSLYTLDVDFDGKHINQAVRIEDYFRPVVEEDSLSTIPPERRRR